ncbi:AMP-binding protein [Polaromonas sp. C04]|uniref:class I adenylate-forming enzyme family protein n=1 Tax=Polaromonas sp. C04 TaxID=1945857 RepID=UPI000984EE72|nr:AMP-binding protein [Polaromonas sp. C04]OOG60915.1 AMP-dependent synthetase [Polaromonas sp. C04]
MIDMPVSAEARRIRRIALGDLVHRTAQKYGAHNAVVDGDVRLSYTELNARSSQFAHHLLQSVGSGRQIGMLCANSADMLVAINGIHKSGNVWVPVNIKLEPPAIDYILRHAEVSCVVVDEAIRAQPGMAGVLDALAVPLVMTMAAAAAAGGTSLQQALLGRATSLPEIDIDGQQPALIMYTSGTTGHPKGVVHSHASAYSAIVGNLSDFAMTPGDVLTGLLPLFHCAQHVLAASACAVGASVVLARAFVPGEVARLVTTEKVTMFVGLPMMYAALLADTTYATPDYSAMRLCIYAMAPMPRPLIQKICEKMTANIMLATGQTEVYPATMSFRPVENPQRDANYWGTCGVACEAAIMDDAGRLLPPGEVGEIVHRGPNVMLGYFKDPQATAEAQKYGWHHTGDLGMFDDGGQMLFLDRKKDMIKTGGENVASVKVEAVILAHPDVAAAAVLGLPHPHWSEAVCAFVVRKPGATCDEAAIIEHCRPRLGSFEVPKAVRFVAALPATATGKIQKNLLRKEHARLWDGAAAGTAP